MKHGINRRVLSLLLCFCMMISMLPQIMPVFSVAATESTRVESNELNTSIDKQAIFDWYGTFDIAGDVDSKPGDVLNVSYDDIGASNLVVLLKNYYYDSADGSHWYKVAAREGETLPGILSENPWVWYTSDVDIEEGYDPCLCIYEANEKIRFTTYECLTYETDEFGNILKDDNGNPIVLDKYVNYYVLSGPEALENAEISITAHDSDYPISDLAYVELTYGTIFSKAFDITITKNNKEAWTPSDGLISIRYESYQLGVDSYTEDCSCGAGFVYIENQLYSAASTDRWGYETSDVVYTNSGSSLLVFEIMPPSFQWVGTNGYFVNNTVRLFDNHFVPKEYMASELPETFYVSYYFTHEGEDYFWLEHKDIIGSPYFIVRADDVILEQALTDYSGEITVSGKLPHGVDLETEKVSLDTLATVYPNPAPEYDYSIADTVPHVVYDISLLLGGSQWQPLVGSKVTVTIDSEDLQLTPGDDYLVYHLHVDENGTPIPEWLGLFNSENGEATFEMDRFSYVLVLNPDRLTLNNSGVVAFYPVSSYAADPCELPPAGNGQWFILGIYFDTDNVAHVLLGSQGGMPALDKIDWVMVDGVKFYNGPTGNETRPEGFKEVTLTPYDGSITQIDMISGNSTTTVINMKKVTNAKKQVLGGVLDIKLDASIELKDQFELALKSKQGGDSLTNSFNIGKEDGSGVDVNLFLEYNIQKEVAVGTSANTDFAESATVNRGDWVIYRIAINNTGTLPLEGMHLEDFLPAGVFDMNTLQVSLDGALTEDGDMSWQNWNGTDLLFNNYSCEGKFSHYVYIKAQVLTELNIDEDTTYANTATFDGMGMPIIEDSANIVVKAPVKGTLTVSKAVTTANPNDFPENIPAFNFTFTITHLTSGASTTEIMLKGTEYTATVGVPLAFSLNNGESVVFTGIPAGAQYTVTEMGDPQYTTKVNGQERSSFNGTMTEGGAPVAAFENQFKVRKGTITVNKVVDKAYEYDDLPNDEFTFIITFDDKNKDMSYEYEVDGVVADVISHGKEITIKGGQSFIILDYPNNTPYTITEVANDKYETTVNGVATNVVEGISSTSGTSHTFTNTYNKVLTSLTINKVVNNIESDPIPAGQLFKFELTHPDGTVSYETITISGEIPGGTETAPGKGYGSITIHGLKVGAYTVREVEIRPGFACAWPNNTTTVELTAVGGEVTCTNRYPVYIVYYEAETGGNVSIDEAGFNVITEKFDPSTATPDKGYVFDGWYDVDGNLVSKDEEFAPGIVYDGQTLTAKFKASLTSLVIKKTGHANIDPNQTFLFHVEGENVDLIVTVHGNNPITINGLKVGGEYTVTELTNWSWRYVYTSYSTSLSHESVTNGAKVVLETDGNEITFTNTREENKWLDGDYWLDNLFKRN